MKAAPDVTGLLVGYGKLREKLEAQVKAAKLENNFIFLGIRKDVNELLRAFDIFTLPSLFEGLPNVILEAMATAKPVVASTVDGNPELVQDKVTGLLVPPTDVDALANALIYLLKHKAEAREMGERGEKSVEEMFSLKRQMQNFENLYEEFYNK